MLQHGGGKSTPKFTYLGAASDYNELNTDSSFLGLMDDFQLFVNENDGKWTQLLADSPANQYDLDFTDYAAWKALLPAGARFRHHPAFWSKTSFYPGTYDFSTVAGRLTQNALYATALMAGVSGNADEIDGWNEPIALDGSGLKNYDSGEAITTDEIGQSLQYIRDEDATIEIGLNDFAVEFDDAKTTRYIQLATDLQSGGYPLDYLGIQFHIRCENPPTPGQVMTSIRRMQDATGLPVRITENDWRVASLTGTEAQKQREQRRIAKNLILACRKAGVDSFTLWTVTDKFSWIYANDSVTWPTEQPGLFDYYYKPKALWNFARGI